MPLDKKIFVYGGNLGKPQDVPFIIECLKNCSDVDDAFFAIAGKGTDRHYLDEYVGSEQPKHIKLFDYLPKEEYDRMVAACDVGLIFLDHRFTIPNFPSRLLAYMQAGLPVLACTDSNTDIGKVIVGGGFGWWCGSDDIVGFKKNINKINDNISADMSDNAWGYLQKYYNVEIGYKKVSGLLNCMKADMLC